MSHLPLDARAILEYLNELGFRNISAIQLKEFMKDLRKLIKYEENFAVNIKQPDYFENLFKRTTASYRAKVNKENPQSSLDAIKEHKKCNGELVNSTRRQQRVLRENHQHQNTKQIVPEFASNVKTLDNASSSSSNALQLVTAAQKTAPSLNLRKNTADINDLRRQLTENLNISPEVNEQDERDAGAYATAQTRVKRRPKSRREQQPKWEPPPRERSRVRASVRERSVNREQVVQNVHSPKRSGRDTTPSTRTTSTLVSRRRLRSRSRKAPFSDPVALYHYYQREWEYFRNQIPGENSHADLRWQIRHKLLNPN